MSGFDKDLFIFTMKRNGDDVKTLAKALKMSLPNLYHKISGRLKFTLRDVCTIKKRWSLTAEQIDKIFFAIK